MAIYLTEQDIEQFISMPETIEALDQAFRHQASHATIVQARRRTHLPDGTFHIMEGADLDLEMFGIKIYSVFPRNLLIPAADGFRPAARFLFLLYDARSGDLLAIMEADRLGQMRTGAASGVATRYLARKDGALRVGLYGAGWQARSQLEAVCAVREIAGATVYSRDQEKCSAFCTEMSARLGVSVIAADSPQAAADGQDIVITATSSATPVLQGEWLKPGAHVCAVGSNMLMKREIDEIVVKRSAVIVVDSVEQAKIEAGDLLPAFERRLFRWEQVAELHEIVSGAHPGRTDDNQITLFKSIGIALEDVAVGAQVYRNAIAAKRIKEILMWQPPA